MTMLVKAKRILILKVDLTKWRFQKVLKKKLIKIFNNSFKLMYVFAFQLNTKYKNPAFF